MIWVWADLNPQILQRFRKTGWKKCIELLGWYIILRPEGLVAVLVADDVRDIKERSNEVDF